MKTAGAADGGGEAFEVKLLTLVYLRLLDSGSEFYLGSNMAAAGLFDDIVVKYRADSQRPWNTSLLQLKHKRNTASIDNALVALNSDFSLVKYCDSYVTLKSSSDEDFKFLGNVGDFKFIIFTNCNLKGDSVRPDVAETLFDAGGGAVSFVKDSTVFKKLCEWIDLKSILNGLKNEVKDKSDAEVVSAVIKRLSELPEYLNNAVQLTVKGLIDNASTEGSNARAKLDETITKLKEVRTNVSYREFLDNLKLYKKQANEMQLEKKIKEHLQSISKCGSSEACNVIFFTLNEKVKWWWQKKQTTGGGKKMYLTQASRIWLDIIKAHVERYSSRKLNQPSKLYFQDHSLAMICKEIPWSRGGILNVSVESRTTASSIKVMQALARFGEEDNILYVDLATLLESEDELIGLWSSRWCRVLVVECDTELDSKDAARLSDKVNNVVEGTVPRKLFIYIGKQINELSILFETLGSGYSKFDDGCNWADLSKISQLSLHHAQIELQGSRSILATLVKGNTKFEEKVNGDVISQLLCGETVCGKEVEAAPDVFVPRRLSTPDGVSLPVNSVRDVKNKVVLVVAEPGMGKSTLMTRLAHSAKAEDPTAWVVHLKLNECTEHLANMDLESFNSHSAKKILGKVSLNPNKSLEVALFWSLEQNLTLFVDGVDEVCPQFEDKVIEFLRCLTQLQIKQLWITSRPIMRQKLEFKLAVTAFVLDPFMTQEYEEFFVKVWSKKNPNTAYTKLETFANKLRDTLKEAKFPFWQNPLMAALIADVFEEDLRAFIRGDVRDDDLAINSIKLDILVLYNTFMQKNFDLYFVEKIAGGERARQLTDVDEDIQETYNRNQQLTALRYLCSANEISALQFQGRTEFMTSLEEFLKEIASGMDTTGINDNGTAHSDRCPFTEYFAASSDSENFTLSPAFTWVRAMFNRFLTKDHAFHTAVLNCNE